MQVALEAPALGVADLDDARPGRRQLLVGVGVGQRLRDEVGEVAQPLLELRRQRVLRRRHRRQHAPQPAADADRRGHAGAVADAAQHRGEGPARLVVALHALRAAAAGDLRDQRVAVEPQRRADREARRAVLAPGADDRRAYRGPSSCITFAPGSPSRRPTSSVTASKTRLGDGSPATSVATRRSAACSSASARCAASARVRSAVTAAEDERGDRRGGDEQLRRQQAVGDRVAHERPVALRGVPHGDRADDEDRRGRAARAEAQRGPEEHREDDERHVALRRQLGQHHERERSRPAASKSSRRRMPANPIVTQVSSAGATTRTPAASPRIHVRTTLQSSPDSITPPRRRASGPIAPLITAASTAQATSARTSPTRARSPRPPVRRRSASAATTSATVFPTVCASTVANGVEKSPSRRSPITMPGHSRIPTEEEHGQAEPRGRPERRDRAVEIRELEADLAGEVVRDGQQPDGAAYKPDRRRAESGATARSICAGRGGSSAAPDTGIAPMTWGRVYSCLWSRVKLPRLWRRLVAVQRVRRRGLQRGAARLIDRFGHRVHVDDKRCLARAVRAVLGSGWRSRRCRRHCPTACRTGRVISWMPSP